MSDVDLCLLFYKMMYRALLSPESFSALHEAWYTNDEPLISLEKISEHQRSTLRRNLFLYRNANEIGDVPQSAKGVGLEWEHLLSALIPKALSRCERLDTDPEPQ